MQTRTKSLLLVAVDFSKAIPRTRYTVRISPHLSAHTRARAHLDRMQVDRGKPASFFRNVDDRDFGDAGSSAFVFRREYTYLFSTFFPRGCRDYVQQDAQA